MSNIFQKNKLVTSMNQASNLGRLFFRSKFETKHKNDKMKKCGNNCVSCPYLYRAIKHQLYQLIIVISI